MRNHQYTYCWCSWGSVGISYGIVTLSFVWAWGDWVEGNILVRFADVVIASYNFADRIVDILKGNALCTKEVAININRV